MKNYIKHHPWQIIEEGFDPELNEISESLCSIGNGRFGQRANFEEKYSGKTLQGSYVAGVFFPDKTRVGWWKIGYPNYFAKVLNSPNWIGINIQLDGEDLDLAKCKVSDFRRVLNMKEGILERTFKARLGSGKEIEVKSTRFCSIHNDEVGAIQYSVKALNFSGELTVSPYLDGDVENKDSNYEEKFWNPVHAEVNQNEGYLITETKENPYNVPTYQVAVGMKFSLTKNGEKVDFGYVEKHSEKFVSSSVDISVKDEDEVVITKYCGILSSLNYEKGVLLENVKRVTAAAFETGFDTLLNNQKTSWAAKWEEADIQIEGDVAAQQGMRFNIFQLYQTYTGEDERLNIGPKGFTGEKYGGSTYWDTEAYCLDFYLATADPKVARQLLIYRYRHLQKAIENAAKLGFKDGAALYPMVTMTGEECHNEWEITFEEIHRNGAIAFAVYDYIRYTGDADYLNDYGLELLIGISRFWAQRVHYSSRRDQYVMHGVTGPNEYENNVNNNYHTNNMAKWCLEYTMKAVKYVEENAPEKWEALKEKIKFYPNTEMNQWKEIAANMYLPYDDELDVFVQHDGFLDKEWEKTATDLTKADRPINQNWSWDRILRSVYIKQADTLQSLYVYEDQYDEATIRKNFEFYEPRTVHESSLSPCIHSVLAAKLGMEEKAYEMYLRTSRLDLDDYNNDTEDGLHITSMAGSWLAVVQGFGGMRAKENGLHFSPYLPKNWDSFSFKIQWRGYNLEVKVGKEGTEISNHSERNLELFFRGKKVNIGGKSVLKK